MKDKEVVSQAGLKVMNYLIDDLDLSPKKRIRLYRKVGLDLLDLSLTMKFEREQDDY